MVRSALEGIIEEAGGVAVAAEETSKALVTYEDIEWESDGCEDIQPSFPIIKLVQRTSGMDEASRHLGEFWHSDRDGDDAYESDLELVGLVKRDTRAMFEKDNQAPICMSGDGVAPLENQPLWEKESFFLQSGIEIERPLQFQPKACSTCPLSMWSKNDEPPPCKESKVVLVVRKDDDSLAQLRISGTSIRPFEQMVAKYLRPKRLPLYSKTLRITSQTRKKPTKVWEEMEFHPIPLDVEEALVYAGILREQRQIFEKAIADEGAVIWQDDAPADDGRDLPFE